MHGHDEPVAFAVPPGSLPRPRRIPVWTSALLGALSFAGWFGALLLDAKVFSHNTLGSFLAHLPLMLVPAALLLALGLPRLPQAERTIWRVVFAWALAILLTVPALAPQLVPAHSIDVQDAFLFVLLFAARLPIYGLGLALALADPGMRLGVDQQRSRRFSPATIAGAAFGVCAVVTSIVALSLPQPQPTCHRLGCGALVVLGETVLCGAALWTALIALAGAALGYKLGEVTRARWRLSPRVR